MSDVIDPQLLASVFVTLFVIMDPPGTVPVFLALTSTMTAKQRRRAARQAIAVAFGVIVVFALFGQQVLDYMHISLPRCRRRVVCCSCSWRWSSSRASWTSPARLRRRPGP